MDAAAYDAWYRTPRGAWIGDVEFRRLAQLLSAERGELLLDVGCGTGYFAGRFAREAGLCAVGIDSNAAWIDFALGHAGGGEHYVVGTALALPFDDLAFDRAISVAALCFVADARQALREMIRVTRRRFAIGLLNRHSLLYLQKGTRGGSGAYRGARWHTVHEARALFDGLPVANVVVTTAVLLPGGGPCARRVEAIASGRPPLGAFIAAAGDVSRRAPDAESTREFR